MRFASGLIIQLARAFCATSSKFRVEVSGLMFMGRRGMRLASCRIVQLARDVLRLRVSELAVNEICVWFYTSGFRV